MAAKYTGPTDALEKYEALVARFETVKRKGAANPYTSLNGHMFSFLDRGGTVALRFSDQDRAEFTEQYESGPSIQYGKTMQGYATVPGELLDNTDELATWFQRSYDYIATLKPKPTTRKKK